MTAAHARGPLLSIHMSSNRPNHLAQFLDRLETVTADPASVEVVIKIDDTDEAMNRLLPQEQRKRPFRVKYLSTPLAGGFYNLWRSYDELLRAAHPDAYFVIGLNDEMYFETQNWDLALQKYVGLFPDRIFRLRTSNQRHRNYFDFWEAGFANDTSAIMTKRWLEIGGGWCPCNGPDTFQQCVAFYFGWLHRFRADRINREIAIPDVNFAGQGANIGGELKGRALRRRISGSIRSWSILMSHKMQQEAARRAQTLHAHIWAEGHQLNGYQVRQEARNKRVAVVDVRGNVLQAFSYSLSATSIALTNVARSWVFARYGYVGDEPFSRRKSFAFYLGFRYEYFGRLLDILIFEPDERRYDFVRSVAFWILSAPTRVANLFRRVWRRTR